MPGPSIAELDETLAPVRHLLLDFDGVLCRLYQPAARAEAASVITRSLTSPSSGFTGAVPRAGDPAEVLYLSGAGGRIGETLEGEASALELAAAATATPVSSAADLLASARESGRTVTVVSSCAARAVNAYLHRAGLSALAGLTVARQPRKPASAAPAALLARAARRLAGHPGTCAVVSARPGLLDAASDAWILPVWYRAEHAPGTPSGRPLVTVTGLDQLVLWFRARPLRDNIT